ncbi:MAG: hypothetical protein NTV09_07065 [Bacteroidetes bacterium]|nr:hypothetical protein [Bacteroidota bacterium]
MDQKTEDLSFSDISFRNRKLILYSGILFFLIHFIFSYNWFKERMLQDDGPFLILKMIQHSTMLCEHYRYSSFLIQWLPFTAMRFGASVEWITRFYSVSMEIYYFLFFIFCIHFLKNYKGALLMLLFLCLVYGREYFLPASEYHPSIITSLLIFGLPFSSSQKHNRMIFAGAFLIILIAINFHPVSIFALGFIILFEFINADKRGKMNWVVVFLFAAVIFLARKLIVPFDNYENNKLSSISSLGDYIFHPEKLKSLVAVIHYFSSLFPELIVLFLYSFLLLRFRKKFVSAAAVILYTCFVFYLFSVIKGVDETNIWFGEYFILGGIPALIPITLAIARKSAEKFVLPVFLLLAFSLCIYRLEMNYGYFASKIAYADRLNENGKYFPEKKYIISDKNVPRTYIRNTWPVTFQTLLLSSFNNPDSAKSFIILQDVNSCDSLISNPNYFLGPEWDIQMFNASDNKIRKSYFNFPSKGYRKLTTSQQYFSAPDSVFNAGTISISPVDSVVFSNFDSVVIVKLKISNTSTNLIPAIPDSPNSTLLSYHVFSDERKLITWDNLRTPFETDISADCVTGLNISTAGLKKGTYIIESDIVTENKRWWGINSQIKLVVN